MIVLTNSTKAAKVAVTTTSARRQEISWVELVAVVFVFGFCVEHRY